MWLDRFLWSLYYYLAFRLVKFSVEGKLEFEIIRDDELKFLPNWSISSKLKPGSSDTMDAVVKC